MGRPGRSSGPLSPSDLRSQLTETLPQRFSLGGRVARRDGGFLWISDALGSVRVQLSQELRGTEITAGDLVRLTVNRTAGSTATGSESPWRVAAIEQHLCCPEPTGRSEQQRLGQGRGPLLVARHRARCAVRDYFAEQDFIEVETPTFVPCPGLDPHVNSLAQVSVSARQNYLITSPEFHMKRLLVGGVPRIYQLARCFRAEELGAWHEPEFTLVEWYRAFSDFRAVMRDTEELVRRIFSRLDPQGEHAKLNPEPFTTMTVREAFQRFAQVDDAVSLDARDPDNYFQLLVDRVEPGLSALGHPVFLTHYPLAHGSLARPCPQDPTVAERFELYFRGVELCNGFGELTDSADQRARFERERARRREAGEPVYPLDERFLCALEEGMPPSGGNALGLDRLIALATGANEIAATMAFSDSER